MNLCASPAKHMCRYRWLGVVALGAMAVPAVAEDAKDDPSQESAAPGPAASAAQSYAAAYFTRYAPKTARDMLNQVPGFVIRQPDAKRGLGEASTNILINGERFSGKSNDIVTELARISATNVVRIDILDGATLAIPGLSGQVANIIVNGTKKWSGQFEWNPQTRLKRLPPNMTNGKVSISGSLGKADVTFAVDNSSYAQGNAGLAVITDRFGALIENRDEDYRGSGEVPKVSLGIKYKSAAGSIANLNAAYQLVNYDNETISLRSGPGQVDRDRRFHNPIDGWNYEFSGDYEFGLGKGRLKLIVLNRAEHISILQRVITRFADNSPATGQRYARIDDTGESILRGEYGWQAGRASWQIGAEGALNTIDSKSAFALLGADGVFPMPPLTGESVKEKRGEVSLSYGRPLSPNLSLQALVAAEYSQLSQTGAAGKTRTFYRPKGFLSLAWKPSPRLDISVNVAREVGQLDFADFLASVSLGNDTGNSGNPDLVPPQDWKGQIEITRNLGAYGTATARFYGYLYEDVIDIIPIGADGQSVGNIDKARLLGFYWKSSFNLDPFGIKGAKFDIEAEFKKSRVRDPLTGTYRSINGTQPRGMAFTFRHDIPNTDLAYGASFEEGKSAATYRLDEIFQYNESHGTLSAYIEHKDVLGLTMRANLSNLLGKNDQNYRTIYDGRRTNPVLSNEFRNRNYGMTATLSISGKI